MKAPRRDERNQAIMGKGHVYRVLPTPCLDCDAQNKTCESERAAKVTSNDPRGNAKATGLVCASLSVEKKSKHIQK